MRLIATKTRRYGTRALRVGDPFDVSSSIGRALVAVGHARPDTGTYLTKAKVPADAELAGVRAEYEVAIGKKAFHGWDGPTLKAKIAEHVASKKG